MNRFQLSQILARRLQVNPRDTRKLIDMFSGLIEQALSLRQDVTISNFGSFYIYKTKSRAIPHPKKSNQKMITLGANVPKFRPSSYLKEKTIKIKPPAPSNILDPQSSSPPPSTINYPLKISDNPVNVPFIKLKDKIIPKEILTRIPEHIARTYQIVPVEEKNNKLIVAMVNPEDLEAIEFVKKKTGMELLVNLTSAEELNSILDQYSGLVREVEKTLQAVETEESKQKRKPEPTTAEKDIEAPVSRLVLSLLTRAVKDKASDVHIEPQEKELTVRFRIDGILQKAVTLPKNIQPSIIARIKIMTNLKTDETRIPQDGRFSLSIEKREVDFRVSTMPTVYGEKVVMRILDKSHGILTLEQLGLISGSFKALEENIHKSHGMILITGPTGCGKTTTLYAILDKIYDVGINIVTLEDPVEYKIPGINQSQVNLAVDYHFANGLRSIVRQDPDVIMLGEIRDNETASMAVHAALTGHIVLSTLHTNDASGTIPRLIDMQIEPFLIASSLNLVVAQRLCRKVCENCRTIHQYPEEVINDIQQEIRKMPLFEQKELQGKKFTFFRGKGCNVCNQTGYKGRIGIFEVLSVDENIKQLIIKQSPADLIAKTAISKGMLTLKQDGIKKVLQGLTTIEEITRVTKE